MLRHLAPRTLVLAILCAAAALIVGALWFWRNTSGATFAAFDVALPIAPSIMTLLLPCIAALAAIELRQHTLAAILAGAVTFCMIAVIAGWLSASGPLFGYHLFVASGTPTAWFPNSAAVASATMVIWFALVIALLSFRKLSAFAAPLAWAVGLCILVGAPSQLVWLTRFFTVQIGWPAVAIVFLLMAMGTALMLSRATRDQVHERGARLRAVIVVLAVASTLALWQTVRSGEIARLRADVESAREEARRDIRQGILDNSSSIERLGAHFTAVSQPLPPEVFLNDARFFMRNYLAGFIVFVTDTAGRVRYAARRARALDSEPSAEDEFVAIPIADAANGFAALNVPLPIRDGRFDIAVQSLTNGAPIRGQQLPRSTDRRIGISSYPIFAADRNPLGALVIVLRSDISTREILRNSTPDFNLRVSLDGAIMYERLEAPVEPLSEQFRLITPGSEINSRYGYDVTPGSRVIQRNLTAVPILVLVFTWASLGLAGFALYNERRAKLVSRDRERILNESLDVICTLDTDGRYVTVNDAVERILGYKPAEVIGRRYRDIAHPDDVAALDEAWRRAQNDIRPPSLPIRFLHKNGRTVYLQGNAHWSAEEALFYCDMRDVTEQHELESAREYAASTFRTGVELAGCMVYEYRPRDRSVEWVGSVLALTGYEPVEFSAAGFDGWMQAIHPDDRQHALQTLQRCIETGRPHIIDYRLRRKDGTYMPVLDRGRQVRDNERDPAPRVIGAVLDLSTMRHQEHALRRSEERYRIIATQVGAVIIEREIATNRLVAHGPVEQIFGYSKEQIESRPVTNNDVLIHPEDRERVLNIVRRAQASVSNYYVEYRRRHRGGHYIHVAARAAILPGPDGRAERSVVAYTDITERKQAEERLSESEERFRLAAEQARQIVYEYLIDDTMQVVQRRVAGAVTRVLGYTTEEMRDLSNPDRFHLIHADDVERVRTSGGDAASGYQFQVEHRLQHKDGHYVHVENRGAIKRDAEGKVIGIVGMLLDISARTAAEQDRQRYTVQLRMLADIARRVSTFLSLHELLNYLARSMRDLIDANAAGALIYGGDAGSADSGEGAAGSIVAVSFAERYGLQRSAPRPFGSSALHDLVRGGTAPVRLTIAQTQDDPRWSTLTQNDDLRHPLKGWLGVALTSRDGAHLGLLELTDKPSGDFSDGDMQVMNQLAGVASVAIENILLYATLEERVAARTRELEISNRELEAFSYSVSHDLRAPLRAIAGFSSILEQEYGQKLDSAARRYLQRIGTGVERMANLIDDLLSLARVSRLDIKRETIDLTALCRTIAKRQRERFNDRDIDVKIDPRMRTTADPRLVEVALENLIENAIKFTGTRPTGQIHIGRRIVDGRPAFFVRDNGVGFDPQYASNLFGVFQRLHSASEFPGTGVGLATVQRIVQRHQGRVWAESQIDQGAVFYFTFENEA